MAGRGLASAAVGLVCTWRHTEAGLGWGVGCFPAPMGSMCATTVVLVPDFSGSVPVDLCGWLCEQCTWGTRGPMACIPTVEVGLRAMPTTVYVVSPHNGWQVMPQSTFPGGQLQRRNTQWPLSQQERSNPSCLTLQLRNESGGLYSNNQGADPAPDRAVTTTEQRGPIPYPVQAVVTTTPVTPHQGGTGHTHWGKMWWAFILKTAIVPKILNSHRLQRDACT